MKKKYEIRLDITGEDPMVLGTMMSKLRRFFNGGPSTMEWIHFAQEKGQVLYFDRDEAKYLMAGILAASHKARAHWMTEWDWMKMVACIRQTSTSVFEDPPHADANPEFKVRYVKLMHVKGAAISLIDVEKHFAVHAQSLDYFKAQTLTLQD